MPAARDFLPVGFQATVFTPDAAAISATTLNQILSNWLGHFNAEPQLLPSAPGLPPEVPRAILQSVDQLWRAEVANGRVNIYWRTRRDRAQPAEDLGAAITTMVGFLEQYLGYAERPRVGRMAAVLTAYCQHNNPAEYLARHFCQERWWVAPLNRPANFELHAHKQYSMGGWLRVNSWVRNKTALLQPDLHPIILVEQDLNTPEESAREAVYTPEDVHRFFDSAIAEFQQILGLYYPEARETNAN